MDKASAKVCLVADVGDTNPSLLRRNALTRLWSYRRKVGLIGALVSWLLLGALGAQGALAAHGIARNNRLMAKEASISTSQAAQDISTQEAAGNIVPKLTKALGADYGGVWFDDQSGVFNIGVTSQADVATAAAVMKNAGVLSDTKVSMVSDSWTSVEAAAAKWDESESSLVSAQQAIAIPNPRIDGLTIEVATNLSTDLSNQVVATSEATPVATQIAPTAPSQLQVKADSCTLPYCGRPLRGGIGIQSSPEKGYLSECTAGFFVRDANNYPYLLTAAHCVYPINSVYWLDSWGTAYPGGKEGCGLGKQIAQILGEGGDAAVIETEGCEPPVPETDIVAWGIENNYYIKPEPYTAYDGLYECHIGRTSGTRCGDVEAANITISVNYEKEGEGVKNVQHEDWLCALSEPGDSGGPYAAGHWGTAIETASNGTSCGSFGDELSYALNALGVHMPTS